MLEAFAAGAAAWAEPVATVHTSARTLGPGAAAFYGVRPAWRHLWQQALDEDREWYYLDNAWFDAGRERYFRVGVNALQSWSQTESDGARARALGIRARDPGKRGVPVLVCAQSDEFLRCVVGIAGGLPEWLATVETEIRRFTDRPIIVRTKVGGHKLSQQLPGAWAVVTHASATANEALLAGVPVIVTDPECAAARFGTRFADIEDPNVPDPDHVQAWAERLADSQWTLQELRDGAAWRAIHAG